MKKKTIGIIGPGRHFEKYIFPLLKKYKFLKISGILRKKEKNFRNIKAFTESIFFKKKFDFIYISCPNHLHEKYILKSIENDAHVICEKPFIINSNKINSIIFLAKKKKKLLFEAFMYQFHPCFNFIDKIIKTKKYGKMQYLIANFRFPSLEKTNNRYDPETGGGFFLDAASYLVSLERAIFKKKKYKKNEFISQKIRKQVDLRGNIFINSNKIRRFYFWGEGQSYTNSLEIFFDHASIYVDKFFSKKNNEQIMINIYKNKKKIIKLKKTNHFKSMFDTIFQKYLDTSFKNLNYLKIQNQINLMNVLK